MKNYGKIYIVATPIGNFQDITLRSLDTLKKVDTIICEDTRVSKKLLNHFNINKPLISYNNFNEDTRTSSIIKILQKGKDVALISDAGTPLISDPGYLLIRQAKAQNIEIESLPGASSIITALTLSSIPCNKFAFLGFLDKSSVKKQKMFVQYASLIGLTLVMFESPKRVITTLNDIKEVFGNQQQVCFARELTKQYEEVKLDTVENLISHFNENTPLGEFVIIFQIENSLTDKSVETIEDYIKNHIDIPAKQLASELASMFNSKKSTMYEKVIKFKENNHL